MDEVRSLVTKLRSLDNWQAINAEYLFSEEELNCAIPKSNSQSNRKSRNEGTGSFSSSNYEGSIDSQEMVAKERIVSKLMKRGYVSKALDVLCRKDAVCKDTVEAIGRLTELHTQIFPDKAQLNPPDSKTFIPYYFHPNQVKRSIQSTYNSSTPGILKVHLSLVKQLLTSDDDGQRFLKLFSGFLTQMANGSLPRRIFDILSVSMLVPISKKQGGIRPIAIPDTFRKIDFES